MTASSRGRQGVWEADDQGAKSTEEPLGAACTRTVQTAKHNLSVCLKLLSILYRSGSGDGISDNDSAAVGAGGCSITAGVDRHEGSGSDFWTASPHGEALYLAMVMLNSALLKALHVADSFQLHCVREFPSIDTGQQDADLMEGSRAINSDDKTVTGREYRRLQAECYVLCETLRSLEIQRDSDISKVGQLEEECRQLRLAIKKRSEPSGSRNAVQEVGSGARRPSAPARSSDTASLDKSAEAPATSKVVQLEGLSVAAEQRKGEDGVVISDSELQRLEREVQNLKRIVQDARNDATSAAQHADDAEKHAAEAMREREELRTLLGLSVGSERSLRDVLQEVVEEVQKGTKELSSEREAVSPPPIEIMRRCSSEKGLASRSALEQLAQLEVHDSALDQRCHELRIENQQLLEAVLEERLAKSGAGSQADLDRSAQAAAFAAAAVPELEGVDAACKFSQRKVLTQHADKGPDTMVATCPCALGPKVSPDMKLGYTPYGGHPKSGLTNGLRSLSASRSPDHRASSRSSASGSVATSARSEVRSPSLVSATTSARSDALSPGRDASAVTSARSDIPTAGPPSITATARSDAASPHRHNSSTSARNEMLPSGTGVATWASAAMMPHACAACGQDQFSNLPRCSPAPAPLPSNAAAHSGNGNGNSSAPGGSSTSAITPGDLAADAANAGNQQPPVLSSSVPSRGRPSLPASRSQQVLSEARAAGYEPPGRTRPFIVCSAARSHHTTSQQQHGRCSNGRGTSTNLPSNLAEDRQHAKAAMRTGKHPRDAQALGKLGGPFNNRSSGPAMVPSSGAGAAGGCNGGDVSSGCAGGSVAGGNSSCSGGSGVVAHGPGLGRGGGGGCGCSGSGSNASGSSLALPGGQTHPATALPSTARNGSSASLRSPSSTSPPAWCLDLPGHGANLLAGAPAEGWGGPSNLRQASPTSHIVQQRRPREDGGLFHPSPRTSSPEAAAAAAAAHSAAHAAAQAAAAALGSSDLSPPPRPAPQVWPGPGAGAPAAAAWHAAAHSMRMTWPTPEQKVQTVSQPATVQPAAQAPGPTAMPRPRQGSAIRGPSQNTNSLSPTGDRRCRGGGAPRRDAG